MLNLEIGGIVATEPDQTPTKSGKSQLKFSVAHNERVYDEQARQWRNKADANGQEIPPVWVTVRLFDEHAMYYRTLIGKGCKVKASGKPDIGTYVSQSGEVKVGVTLLNPEIVVFPPREQQPQQSQQSGAWGGGQQAQSAWQQPQQPQWDVQGQLQNAQQALNNAQQQQGAQSAPAAATPWGESPDAGESMGAPF